MARPDMAAPQMLDKSAIVHVRPSCTCAQSYRAHGPSLASTIRKPASGLIPIADELAICLIDTGGNEPGWQEFDHCVGC
jgi:hypothetical protein